MATATQIKDLQTRLDVLFGKGKVKSTEDTWSRNKLALDTMEAAGKVPVLNQSGSTKGKSKASEAALEAYPSMPESYKGMLSDLAGREGYNPNFYLDGSGYLTTGVGLTGKYVADETPFRSMTDHENKAKRLVPGLEYYTPEIQKSIIHAAYRGDLTYPKDDKYGNKAGDPYKWVNHLNNGNWNEAADELLRNEEYFASRGKDSKGNSIDIKNPGLKSYFESIHNTLKEQHYIENPDARPEDSGFISDTIDEGIAFSNKVLRKVDGTVDSAIDSISGWMDEAFSTGEIPKDKVPPTTTQDIPVPEQGVTVPKAENEMATQAQVNSYLKKRNEKQELSEAGRVDLPRRNQRVGEYIGPNEVADNPMFTEELRQLMQQQEVNRMQQGQTSLPNQMGRGDGESEMRRRLADSNSQVPVIAGMEKTIPLAVDSDIPSVENGGVFGDIAKRMQQPLGVVDQGLMNALGYQPQGTVDQGLMNALGYQVAPNRQQASQLNMTTPQGTVDFNPFNVQRYPTASQVSQLQGKEPAAIAYPSKQSHMDNILQQTQLNLDKRSGENYHFDRNGQLVIDINPHLANPAIPMGTVLGGNGQPVLSSNGSMIGSPTQNPAYKAPAGGKGSNATAQSAMDQLTGIKGFGGK
jgi:GH24 family phage-related lysozyme (muramidase)